MPFPGQISSSQPRDRIALEQKITMPIRPISMWSSAELLNAPSVGIARAAKIKTKDVPMNLYNLLKPSRFKPCVSR